MSQNQLAIHTELTASPGIPAFSLPRRRLSYRLAMPFIFAASLGMWLVLWEIGTLAVRILIG